MLCRYFSNKLESKNECNKENDPLNVTVVKQSNNEKYNRLNRFVY